MQFRSITRFDGRPRAALVCLAVLYTAALFLAACAQPAAQARTDGLVRPPFVEVGSRGGARLFLLGTIHAGPEAGWRFSPEIDAALAASDALVLELDLTAMDEAAIGSAVAERAILQGGKRLRDVISPETRRLLDERDERLSAVGLHARAIDLYEPWFLTVNLLEIIARDSAYSMQASVESQLLERRGDRPIIALETFEEQLDLFDRLSPKVQDAMLRDTLANLDDANEDFDRLVAAWRVADRPTLIEESRAGTDEIPELEAFYVVLSDQRNARWTEQLDAILRDPSRAGQTLFVAVGALHVVGDLGVPRLLEGAGHRVTHIH